MKAKYNVLGGKVQFEVEGSNEKDIFRQFAKISEVFDEKRCGQCGKNDLHFVVRSVEKDKKVYEYFEMKCISCGSRLAYGQHQTGGSLFPKRKLDDDTFDKKNLGWGKYQREGGDAHEGNK